MTFLNYFSTTIFFPPLLLFPLLPFFLPPFTLSSPPVFSSFTLHGRRQIVLSLPGRKFLLTDRQKEERSGCSRGNYLICIDIPFGWRQGRVGVKERRGEGGGRGEEGGDGRRREEEKGKDKRGVKRQKRYN